MCLQGGDFGFKGFDLGDGFLQRSGQQGHQLGLVDALVDRVAIGIHLVLGAGDSFRNNSLRFVGDEAVYGLGGVGLEVEAVNWDLTEAINGAGQRGDVFLEAVVGGGVVSSG